MTASRFSSFLPLGLLVAGFLAAKPESPQSEIWTFVSIPDFLNFDIEYPQKGWEDALGFIVGSMKKEDPAFAMVAGDLVMGHWGTKKEEINKWADKYYPGWVQRFKDHDLKVYAALGDHEIRDNPWRGAAADAVPFHKDAFRRHLKMPLNGPDHMKGAGPRGRGQEAGPYKRGQGQVADHEKGPGQGPGPRDIP